MSGKFDAQIGRWSTKSVLRFLDEKGGDDTNEIASLYDLADSLKQSTLFCTELKFF